MSLYIPADDLFVVFTAQFFRGSMPQPRSHLTAILPRYRQHSRWVIPPHQSKADRWTVLLPGAPVWLAGERGRT
jgi:hypothetical protein